MKLLQRDLKVCEACGRLWVRTGTLAGVYCRHCGPLIAALPPRRRRNPGRPCRSTHPANGPANAAGLFLVPRKYTAPFPESEQLGNPTNHHAAPAAHLAGGAQ